MSSTPQPAQTGYHSASLNTDQSYANDHVLVQHWYNNNGQPAEQTRHMSSNQFAQPPFGQQLLQQQQSLQQHYVTSNQGMQQYMHPLIGQQVTYQQQAPALSHYIQSNSALSPSTLMNQPIVTSTPGPTMLNNQMAQASKRQIDDVSRSGETSINMQQTDQQPRQRYGTRYITPKKLKTVTINGGNPNGVTYKAQNTRQGPAGDAGQLTNSAQANRQPFEVSSAAYRFASTRYPFSPYVISFKTAVKDKLVIDELVKHAKEQNVELKIAAYRHKQVENDHRILLFVDNIDSFCFLTNNSNWPTRLCQETFHIKKPSTPPQLCIILPNVSLNTDWDEFVRDMKEQYVEIVDVVRLKNRSQQFVRTVKVEFSCAKARNNLLEQREMSINYMKYRVIEYLTPAQVLICGNCCEIGHFQKNCPHRDKTICKTCGENCNDIKNHSCSGLPKCIRCGEDHKSTDSKCLIVKSYRAALTRNLLQQPVLSSKGFINTNPSLVDFPPAFAKHSKPFTATTTSQVGEVNLDTLLSKKLDSFLEEIKVESKKTRETIDDLRKDMQEHIEESRKKIDGIERKIEAFENKVQTIESEFQDYTSMINRVLENICLVIAQTVNVAPEDKKYFATESQKLKAHSSRSKLTK